MPREIVLAPPANLNPALTHYIVVDHGDWGHGATIAEALAKVPYGKRTKLEAGFLVYHVTAETRIGPDGRFYGQGQNSPVLNESRKSKAS